MRAAGPVGQDDGGRDLTEGGADRARGDAGERLGAFGPGNGRSNVIEGRQLASLLGRGKIELPVIALAAAQRFLGVNHLGDVPPVDDDAIHRGIGEHVAYRHRQGGYLTHAVEDSERELADHLIRAAQGFSQAIQ